MPFDPAGESGDQAVSEDHGLAQSPSLVVYEEPQYIKDLFGFVPSTLKPL